MDTIKHPRRVKRTFKKGQGRKLLYPEAVDQEISKWILEKRDNCNAPVSKQIVRLKALSLIKPFNPHFKASDGWIKSFFQRHNWTLRRQTSIAQMLPILVKYYISYTYNVIPYSLLQMYGASQCVHQVSPNLHQVFLNDYDISLGCQSSNCTVTYKCMQMIAILIITQRECAPKFRRTCCFTCMHSHVCASKFR